ncbi:MBL fold metallo-hydrolase [bacterium]|nr:MBL fold metallo-hydrolase [bacterium]MBU1633988.1 MBL fold metallo-hydrolase [bacterium]MBU1874218.1 MBL fold metallo-hydrolase [bacterium]
MMKQIKYTMLFVPIGFLILSSPAAQPAGNQKVDSLAQNIQWLGQSSIKISTKQNTIYIDPFQIAKRDQADVIFITHDHKDHLDPASISKLLTDKTILVAPLSCREKINELGLADIRFLSPWDSTEINGIHILAVPAYNIKKTNFHPKSKNYLGYVLTIDGVRVYHAGDTERIPEMQQFDCDIALLPLGQKYTMNSVYEAANSALDVKAKIAIPIHYDMFEGKLSDADAFQEILKGKVKVIIKSSVSD